MMCIDVQRLIMPFINGKLNKEELEQFIDHIKACPDCMEEVEVYYALVMGMRQLDEDKELSTNFNSDLMELIKETEDRIFHYKVLHIRKRIILLIIITIVGIVSSFRFGEFVVEDVLHKEEKVSQYLFGDVFVLPELYYNKTDVPPMVNTELPDYIMKELDKIYIYLDEHDKEAARRMLFIFGSKIWGNGDSSRVNSYQRMKLYNINEMY